jgi:hypothetical protein
MESIEIFHGCQPVRLLGKIEEASAAGQQRCQRARTARSAQGSLGAFTCRWSRATWCRRIKISASLAPPDPASKTSQPNMRSTVR